MRKLHLDLDALDVTSFAARGDGADASGTVHGADQRDLGYHPTSSYFTLGHQSCYGDCMTNEYDTCWEAGPSVGPSCDYFCLAQTVGCIPVETSYC